MFWTAFTIGLLGSLHCVGMCGPIACVLPMDEPTRWGAVRSLVLYNLGRMVSYITLGILIGLLGQGLFLAGMQKWLSVAVGAILLVIAVFSIPVERRLLQSPLTGRFYLFLKSQLARFLKNDNWGGLKVGILNGFLPCGLVYMAILGALGAGSLGGGMLYMLLFGLGTTPLMFGTVLAGRRIGLGAQRWLRKLYPVFLAGLAILFILRGIQFNLPGGFTFWEALQQAPMCH